MGDDRCDLTVDQPGCANAVEVVVAHSAALHVHGPANSRAAATLGLDDSPGPATARA